LTTLYFIEATQVLTGFIKDHCVSHCLLLWLSLGYHRKK